jgi:hypothetical protein
MLRFCLALSLTVASVGCVDLDENGLALTPRVPYESNVKTVGEPLEWNGEAVEIDVERGFVEVVGDPDAQQIVVTSHAMTWARYGDVADARAINEEILATATAELVDGKVRVSCGVPSGDHGSAQASSTQCDLRIVIPAPVGATHALTARTGLGDLFLQRLTTAPTGFIDVNVNGYIEAWAISGNVVARAGANDLEVLPIPGGIVDVESTIALAVGLDSEDGLHDAKHVTGTTLRLPETFATQSLVLFSDDGDVRLGDFPDLVPKTQSRPGANPATLISARADWGHVELAKLLTYTTRSRTSPLGVIEQKP